MSALGFLGGLAGAYTAIDRGMQVAKERERADEDRAYLQEQRGLLRQQQQREREAQDRAETLRKDLAAIPTTEQVDLNKLNPETSKITVDDDGNPSATQLPVMVDRKRTTDSQLRDASAAFRKSGDLGRALELNAAADKEMFNRAARSFAQLRAGSANMTAGQIARQAKSIFDNDPFPMEVAAIREGQDGAISIDVRNRDTGQTATWNAKNKDELLSGIEAHYSPDNFVALDQARRKAAIDLQAKRDEELFKPRILKPGETLNVFDPRTGRYIQAAKGDIPAGYEVVEDAAGNASLRRVASPRSGASTTNDPEKNVSDALDFIVKSSQFKETATPQQAARAQTLARQFARQDRVEPAIAAEAAMSAALNPERIRPTFNPRTGRISDAIEYQGGNFEIEDRGTVAAPRGVTPEVMRSIAGEYVSRMPTQDRPLFVAAAFNPEARRALDDKMARAVRSPENLRALERMLGRAPTEQDIARAVKAAVDATAPSLDLIGIHFDREGIKGAVSGSGFALSGGKVVPDAAAGAGRAGSASPAGPQPIPSGQALSERRTQEERQRQERTAAERVASQQSASERAQTQRTLAAEVRSFTPEQVEVMRPGEVQSFLQKYGSVVTPAQAGVILRRHSQSLTDEQKRQLRRRM